MEPAFSQSIEPEALIKVEETPSCDQRKPCYGPFQLVKAPKKDGGGLTWVGVPEKCDRCGKSYPMAWISISEDGKRFICMSCDYQERQLLTTEYAHQCDVCSSIVSVHELTIEYNQLICRRCRRVCGDDEQDTHDQPVISEQDPGRYDHLFED